MIWNSHARMTSGIFKNYYKDNPRHFQVKKQTIFPPYNFFQLCSVFPVPDSQRCHNPAVFFHLYECVALKAHLSYNMKE